MKRAALAVLLLAACARRPHVTSCDDDLGGVWVTPSGTHWMLLDNRATLEAYPMFDDAVPPPGTPPELVLAPRLVDLARTATVDPKGPEQPAPHLLGGELKRRVMRRADTCEARAPVHVTSCADDTLELVLSDPPLPTTLAPCTWPPPAPSRVERWHRD